MREKLKVFGIALAMIAVGTSLVFAWEAGTDFYKQKQFEDKVAYLSQIEKFKTAADYITEIAKEEGGVYALQMLIAVDFEKGLDTHLLGHYAGNELYKQEGLNGMRYCTTDLWYACAHSIVINALLYEGMSVFDVVNDVCHQVPGPVGYDLCFHGFGHGVIAYVEYELPQALELCKLVGTKEFDYSEAEDCVGGVIMDLRDGLHDKDLWREFGKKYIPEGSPAEICEAEYMPNEFRDMCMIYITPFIFDKIGVGKKIPTDDEVSEALTYCEVVQDEELRRSCYRGFPKELISYIHNRDVRVYEESTDEELRHFYAQCQLAPSSLGVTSCVEQSVGALDRRGTHPYTLALRYCNLIPDENQDNKNICYNRLIEERLYARVSPSENEGLCERLPWDSSEECVLAFENRI